MTYRLISVFDGGREAVVRHAIGDLSDAVREALDFAEANERPGRNVDTPIAVRVMNGDHLEVQILILADGLNPRTH